MQPEKLITAVYDQIGIAAIVLDCGGRLVEFTPGAKTFYALQNTNLGQRLAAQQEIVDMPPLPDFDAAIEPGQHPFRSPDGQFWVRRITRIGSQNNDERILIVFISVAHPQSQSTDESFLGNLTRAETHKSAILESALDCIITADVDGRIVDFNPAAVQTFGWSSSEIKGKKLSETIIPEEFREPHLKGLARYLKTGNANILGKRIELVAVKSDGNRIPVEFAVNVNYEHDGTPFFTAYIRDITDRRAQEAAQRENEQLLRRTLDSLFTFVGVCTTDGTLLQANKPALDVAGLSEDDVIGKPFWETYWWSHDVHVQQRLKSAISKAAAGESSRYDVTVRIDDDSLIIIEFQLVPIRNDDGEITFLIPSGIDITERKQAEKELLDQRQELIEVLAESESTKAKLQVIFDQSWYFAGALDVDGRVVDVNRTALEMCGYRHEEVINKPFWETGWWSGSKEIQEIIRQGVIDAAAGESFRQELPYWTADGSQRIVDFILTPARNDRGTVIFIVPTGADITDRKQAEAREKREAEIDQFMSRAGATLASSLDYEVTLAKVTQLCVPTLADWAFVDLVEPDGRTRRVAVAHANPEHHELAKQVSQYPANPQWSEHPPAQGLTGKGVLIREFTDEMFSKAAHNADHERVMRAINPRSFVVVPLAARGINFGALTLLRCDSRQSFDENDFNVATELSRRAAQAIDNARLYEEGLQASHAKSEFIANMSHEIRTPMTAVLGYTDLLIASEQEAEKLNFLKTIKRNGKYLLDIINDILDLSKIESGKMDVVTEQFSLAEVVHDVYAMMKGRAAEKNLEFQIVFEPGVPQEIKNDSKRLRQILINLIGNAIKFTKTGSVNVKIAGADCSDRPGIEFSIIDTGIGISEPQLERLFQPFSQADASVTRAYGGSGLGLAISRRLAKLLGGDITVTSQLGIGSTFTCLIESGEIQNPLFIEPEVEIEQFAEQSPNELDNPTPAPIDCRVLVVDDRRDVRFLAGHILRKFGATVEFCKDGIEAVEFVEDKLKRNAQVDIIFLDMQMPRLSGYEAAAQIRQLGFANPIVALTADAMHGDMTRCLENGCNAYLSKPIDAAELYKTLVQLTRQTRSSR